MSGPDPDQPRDDSAPYDPHVPSPGPAPATPPPPQWPQYGDPQGNQYGDPGQPPQQPGQPAGYGQPGYPPQPAYGYPAYGYGAPTEHPQANTAMVLGIVGLAGTFVCGFLCVLGPFAWRLGAKAKREIDAAPGQWAGRDKANVGMVLGIVTTVLLVLVLLLVVLFVVLVIVAGSTIPTDTTTEL